MNKNLSPPTPMPQTPKMPKIKRAVALDYKPQTAASAPRVKAKGEGAFADAILRQAEEHDIPVVRNPDLTDLLVKVETGDEIPTEAFLAVAEILRYLYTLKGEVPPAPAANLTS